MSESPFLTANDTALLQLVRALRETGYRFVTITPASHERVNRRLGNEWARTVTDVFGWSRPFRSNVLSASIFRLATEAGVVVSYEDGWRSLVRVSSLDGELFLHSAFPTTQSDAVFFGPDTGRLVDAVISHLQERDFRVRRAVDIGCGSGAAAVAIAKRSPDAEVLGVDINPAALRAATLNAALAGVANASAHRSDMLGNVDGLFDLIVSNPPFMIDTAGRAYRDGGGHLGAGLALACVDTAIERLAPGGFLVLFAGTVVLDGESPFVEEARRRLDRAGLACTYRETDPDAYGDELDGPSYGRADRIALGVLTATKSQ